MSNSVRPHRRQPIRLPCPWDSPGKNTEVGCHFLLQRMTVKSESDVAQSCPTLSDPMDCSLPGSSIHGIFQARVLEWGAIAFSLYLLSQFKSHLRETCFTLNKIVHSPQCFFFSFSFISFMWSLPQLPLFCLRALLLKYNHLKVGTLVCPGHCCIYST